MTYKIIQIGIDLSLVSLSIRESRVGSARSDGTISIFENVVVDHVPRHPNVLSEQHAFEMIIC